MGSPSAKAAVSYLAARRRRRVFVRGDASRLPSFPDTRKDGTEGFNGSGSGGTQVAEGRREQGGAQRLRFGRERGAVERRPVAGVELAADGAGKARGQGRAPAIDRLELVR